ncbi:MAG: hypothetical protein IIC99_12820 [Chloroflexi bacterium]|nr:hypothetical protein [Chloroflexota bacterium]
MGLGCAKANPQTRIAPGPVQRVKFLSPRRRRALLEKDSPTTEPYQVQVEENVAVPMRDGISLATDLHRPAIGGRPLEGRFPVLLQRTPYDKSAQARRSEAAFFAARSPASVARPVRLHSP